MFITLFQRTPPPTPSTCYCPEPYDSRPHHTTPSHLTFLRFVLSSLPHCFWWNFSASSPQLNPTYIAILPHTYHMLATYKCSPNYELVT